MRCGQKVLAEKARYNRPKSADRVVESSPCGLSATDDDGMGLATGSSETDYTPPTVFITPPTKTRKRALIKSEEGGRLKIAEVETEQGMCLLICANFSFQSIFPILRIGPFASRSNIIL
jgi:hypothetical protein